MRNFRELELASWDEDFRMELADMERDLDLESDFTSMAQETESVAEWVQQQIRKSHLFEGDF